MFFPDLSSLPPATMILVLASVALFLGWLLKTAPRCPQCGSHSVTLDGNSRTYACRSCWNVWDYR